MGVQNRTRRAVGCPALMSWNYSESFSSMNRLSLESLLLTFLSGSWERGLTFKRKCHLQVNQSMDYVPDERDLLARFSFQAAYAILSGSPISFGFVILRGVSPSEPDNVTGILLAA